MVKDQATIKIHYIQDKPYLYTVCSHMLSSPLQTPPPIAYHAPAPPLYGPESVEGRQIACRDKER